MTSEERQELEASMKVLEEMFDCMYSEWTSMKSDARFLVYRAYKQLGKALEQIEYELYDKVDSTRAAQLLRAPAGTVAGSENSKSVEDDTPETDKK